MSAFRTNANIFQKSSDRCGQEKGRIDQMLQRANQVRNPMKRKKHFVSASRSYIIPHAYVATGAAAAGATATNAITVLPPEILFWSFGLKPNDQGVKQSLDSHSQSTPRRDYAPQGLEGMKIRKLLSMKPR